MTSRLFHTPLRTLLADCGTGGARGAALRPAGDRSGPLLRAEGPSNATTGASGSSRFSGRTRAKTRMAP